MGEWLKAVGPPAWVTSVVNVTVTHNKRDSREVASRGLSFALIYSIRLFPLDGRMVVHYLEVVF